MALESGTGEQLFTTSRHRQHSLVPKTLGRVQMKGEWPARPRRGRVTSARGSRRVAEVGGGGAGVWAPGVRTEAVKEDEERKGRQRSGGGFISKSVITFSCTYYTKKGILNLEI